MLEADAEEPHSRGLALERPETDEVNRRDGESADREQARPTIAGSFSSVNSCRMPDSIAVNSAKPTARTPRSTSIATPRPARPT